MKQLTDKVQEQVTNAWGRPVNQFREDLEIEDSDLGRELPNYLGFRHRTVKIQVRDIGKRIIRYSGGRHRCPEAHDGCLWSCWVFASGD